MTTVWPISDTNYPGENKTGAGFGADVWSRAIDYRLNTAQLMLTFGAPLLAGQLTQLVDGKLADVPHRHNDVIVALQSLPHLHAHQRVQAQVRQRGVRVEAADVSHACGEQQG